MLAVMVHTQWSVAHCLLKMDATFRHIQQLLQHRHCNMLLLHALHNLGNRENALLLLFTYVIGMHVKFTLQKKAADI